LTADGGAFPGAIPGPCAGAGFGGGPGRSHLRARASGCGGVRVAARPKTNSVSAVTTSIRTRGLGALWNPHGCPAASAALRLGRRHRGSTVTRPEAYGRVGRIPGGASVRRAYAIRRNRTFPIRHRPAAAARSKAFPRVRAVGVSNSIPAKAGAVGYTIPLDCPLARVITEAFEPCLVAPWPRSAVSRTPVIAVTMVVT